MNHIVSVTTDSTGNIIDMSNAGNQLIGLALKDLNLACNQKKLLANILDKNYMICKVPLSTQNKLLYQYVFEEWRLANCLFPIHMNSIPAIHSLNKHLKDINSFSIFEQEVIYSLLNGYVEDKNIEYFLFKVKTRKSRGSIKWAVSSLYKKFDCDSRVKLIEMLKYYELDRFLPVSIFPPGLYDL